MSYSLLFDIGMVIVRFDFAKAAAAVSQHCSLGPEAIFLAVNELKDDLECGRLSNDAFLDETIDRIGYTGRRADLLEAFTDVFELNQPMVDLIESEKALGTPLYLLSNTNGIHVPFLFDQYPVFRLFNDAIYSHEVGCMKPDDSIYEITLEKLKIDPSRTIYIDDLPENIDAGKKHGFVGIRYDGSDHSEFLNQFQQAKAELSSL
ncbi:MAG: HAD family phosphatase [Verrucomicrobiota bacterium]